MGSPVRPDELRRLGERLRLRELVAGVAAEPVGQQVLLDAGQRGDALRVAVEAAVAARQGLARLEEAVHRYVDVAELACKARRALDDLALLDHAPAEAGADDRGDGCALRRQRPEELVVGVERGRVAVVVVDDGQREAPLEGATEVVVAPARVGEVRGSARRDDALCARRARRVEADPADAVARDARPAYDVLEREEESLDRDVRPLRHAARALEELVHEKPPRGV
jgi:hypothetical protein